MPLLPAMETCKKGLYMPSNFASFYAFFVVVVVVVFKFFMNTNSELSYQQPLVR